MDSNTILLIIALVLSLPGGLFIGYRMSERRARIASIFGGLIGAVVIAAAIYLYVHNSNISLDGLSFFLGSFFGCSVGAFLGALLANVAVGAGGQTADTSSEY